MMVFLLADSKTYVVVQTAKEGRGSGLEVTIFIQTTEFSIFFEVCPCAEQAYLVCYPAHWRHMWKYEGKCKYCIYEIYAQACILLIVSIPALELNICLSSIFVPRKQNRSEVNVKLKDFINSNGLKMPLSLSLILFLQQNYFFFSTKPIFCDQTGIFSMLFCCMFLPNKCSSSIPYQSKESLVPKFT